MTEDMLQAQQKETEDEEGLERGGWTMSTSGHGCSLTSSLPALGTGPDGER